MSNKDSVKVLDKLHKDMEVNKCKKGAKGLAEISITLHNWKMKISRAIRCTAPKRFFEVQARFVCTRLLRRANRQVAKRRRENACKGVHSRLGC